MFNKTTTRTIANILLVTNIFVWYLIAFELVQFGQSNPTHLLMILAANSAAIAASALISWLIFRNFKNENVFFNVWISAGILVSLIPLALNNTDFASMLSLSIVFGIYFGFGMPKTLGHYAASVEIGKRAKIGGLTFLLIGLMSAILSILIPENVVFVCIILTAIRLIGLLSFRMLGKKEELPHEDSLEKTSTFPLKKTFILYFIPWAIFCLVNYLTVPLITNAFEDSAFISLSPIIENIVIAISAVACGVLADRFGRKRIIMVGFVMLGIGFAVLGLSTYASPSSPTGFITPMYAGYIYTISDGVAWGIFFTMFLLTLWGDLAKNGKVEILFALGALPYIFGNVFRLSLQDLIGTISSTQVFSFASVFLFIAVIPLLYAPETLPEKIIASQELNSYVNKALERVKKEGLKSQKKPQKLSEKNSQQNKVPAEETPEQNQQYEEARKLAEKYY